MTKAEALWKKGVWQGWPTMSQSKGLRSWGCKRTGKLLARKKNEVTQVNERADQEINVGISTAQNNSHM